MRAIKAIGIVIFFIHYYLVLTLAWLNNLIVYLWKRITQTTPDKHHISPFQKTHDHVFASVQDIVSLEGYAITTHHFQTADGADLCFWRIQKQKTEITKPYPILLMHGLLDCSISWFLHANKSNSLPYILAALGYDVWIGNNRGNRLSRQKDNHCPRFWDYNLDHLIQYDQPAIINGITRQTGKEKLIYIGHSQGSTQFLLGLGLHSDLQHKIAVFVGLGPLVSLANIGSHAVLLALSKLYLLQVYRSIGFKQFLLLPKIMSRAAGVLLYNSWIHVKIMRTFISLLCGGNAKNKVSENLFGVIITHQPGGSSVNNTLHWIQCYRQRGIMRRFDYGEEKNMQIYGMAHPPAYCLQHIKDLPFNSYLFRGSSDNFMSDEDFSNLVSKFHPERVTSHELHDYNHLDYLWSETAAHDFYGNIIQIIEKGCK